MSNKLPKSGKGPLFNNPLQHKKTFAQQLQTQSLGPPVTSLLDHMKDGREFESLIKLNNLSIDLQSEMVKSFKEIEAIRGNPVIGYLANVVNSNIRANKSIDYSDDLPFSELINTIPIEKREIDIVLVTPGGTGNQVAKFVDKLRPRFDKVTFIIPNIAMSAGTIFAMSGDEIIMNNGSYIGPIDPQVPNKEGMFIPAQSILTLVEDIKKRGEEAMSKGQRPAWTDLQILNQLDAKDIGNAINASNYSIELVETYLSNYKFKSWTKHSSTGLDVTNEERKERAKYTADLLCSHSVWKSHSRGITRESAWNVCKLQITHAETIGLDKAIRRLWALFYWVFENTPAYKVFISEYYCLIRNDRTLINEPK